MAKKGKILVIDDNKELLLALEMYLSEHFMEIQTEQNPEKIPELLRKQYYDIILLDMNFKAGVNSGNEGLYWMNEILKRDPDAIIIFITAYGEIELAVNAIKQGATDFIQKPWDEEKLLATLLSAMKLRESKEEVRQLKQKHKHFSESLWKHHEHCFVNSQSMKQVYKTIEKVAPTNANILLLGENGVGKEVIAKEIHKQSARRNEVFVKVDLGSLSESLFESELFGYEKGAFTDAKEAKSGRFEIANKGTLFLDEIGNLAPAQQQKLLSALQAGEFNRVGASYPTKADVRLISATNMPLQHMIEEGKFREDLLYRINTIQIEIPPLRERKEDIPLLADFFLEKWNDKYNKKITGLKYETIEKLEKYSWPGNIRELSHSIEKAVIMAETEELIPDDFSFHGVRTKRFILDENLNLEKLEKQAISRALEKHKGKLSDAVKELGVSRKTLYNKIKKYDI